MPESRTHRLLAMDGRGWAIVHLADGNILLDLGTVGLICTPADFTTLAHMIAAGLGSYATGDIIACAGPRRVLYAGSYHVLMLLFDQTMLRLFASEMPTLAAMCRKAVATLGPITPEPPCQPTLPMSQYLPN